MAAITICSDFEVRIWVYIGWNEDFQEKNISNLRYADDITHGRKQRGIKEPLDEGKRREWKTGLKLNIQKVKIMASSLMTSQQIDEELALYHLSHQEREGGEQKNQRKKKASSSHFIINTYKYTHIKAKKQSNEFPFWQWVMWL